MAGIKNESTPIAKAFKGKLGLLLVMCGTMWTVLIVNLIFFQGGLLGFGIQPRTINGLFGIFFAPFLHVGFAHLISNTIPFFILGFLVILDRTRDFILATFTATLISGAGVWLIGNSNSIHVGASGVVFGYLGFLLFRGFFERKIVWIVISLAVGFLFGGMVWGVLPSVPGVSWQSHLFGFIGGIMAARNYKKH